MRLRILVLATVCCATLLHAQAAPAAKGSPPPGLIDGSKAPALISDRAAYRLVLLALTVPESPSDQDLARQNAQLTRLGLSGTDTVALRQILLTFGRSHAQWHQKISPNLEAGGSPSAVVPKLSPLNASAQQLSLEGWTIVEGTRRAVSQQLTADGLSKLHQFVQRAKARMVVWPETAVPPGRSQ